MPRAGRTNAESRLSYTITQHLRRWKSFVRRTSVITLGMMFMSILCPIVARAEDDIPEPTTQPSTLAGQNSRGPLSIEELTINLGFEAEAERRTVRTDSLGFGRPRFAQENRRYRFEETIGFESQGNLFDERVLQYDLMLRLGLSQERFVETRPGQNLSTSPDGTILEYDLSFQLFPAGKITSTAYASQLDDRVPRPFLPSLDRRRERYGVSLFYNDPKLPMELSLDHLFDDISSSRSQFLLDDEERGEDRVRYEATWQPTEYHALHLNYEYERRSEQFSGTTARFDTNRHYLALDHVLQFGPDHRSRLDTLLRVEEESGDLARDVFEFAPQLRLQHSDNLFTTYRAQYLEESYFDLETRTIRGDWGITHELNDRLISSFNFYGLHQESNENVDLFEWGGIADFSFNKENRLGLFTADLSYLHSETNTSSGRRDGLVFSESVTFQDPLPVFLARRQINLATIIVTDQRRLQVFLPGVDYLIVQTGDVTVLQRVPTGRILDRQTVFVTYTYQSFENFDVRRDRIDLRLRQRFKKDLEAYYALSLQYEDLDNRQFLTFRERDINRHRIGLTYRKPRWSAGLEFEFNDDSIDPFQAMHLNGDVVIVQNARHQLDGRTTLSAFRFDGQDFLEPRDTTLFDLGLSYRYLLGNNLESNTTARYRFQHDSLFGDTNGLDITTALVYRIGLFSLRLEGEYDMLDLPSSTDNSLGVWLRLQRDIPVIQRQARR